MFQKASRLKLRFASHKGSLTTEDLWDLSLTKLNDMAKALNAEQKVQDEEDFLEKKDYNTINTVKTKFDIVLHVLKTKQEENKAVANEKVRKETKQKILEIIERKKDGALEEKSVEDLMKELEALG